MSHVYVCVTIRNRHNLKPYGILIGSVITTKPAILGGGKVIFKCYMRDPLTVLCLRTYVWGVQGAQDHHLSRTWDRTRAI